MKQLFLAFYRKLEETDMHFVRYLKNQIDRNSRLIAITSARGTGYRNEIPLWLFGFLY